MSGNSGLLGSMRRRNDEFFTRYEDVTATLPFYNDWLSGKRIYCNADKDDSAFNRYFNDNGYEVNNSSDDFRNSSNLERLNACDVIVTNPPFSLAREYLHTVLSSGKDFIIVGALTMLAYSDVFPLFKEGRIRIGPGIIRKFYTPTGVRALGNTLWLTSFPVPYPDPLVLSENYDPLYYPRYINSAAINIDRVKNIPRDYPGPMGVPLTFLTRYNPEQFTIVGFRKGDDGKDLQLPGRYPYNRVLIQQTGACNAE